MYFGKKIHIQKMTLFADIYIKDKGRYRRYI